MTPNIIALQGNDHDPIGSGISSNLLPPVQSMDEMGAEVVECCKNCSVHKVCMKHIFLQVSYIP